MCRWTSGEARGGRVIVTGIVRACAGPRLRRRSAHAPTHPTYEYNAQRNNTFHYESRASRTIYTLRCNSTMNNKIFKIYLPAIQSSRCTLYNYEMYFFL